MAGARSVISADRQRDQRVTPHLRPGCYILSDHSRRLVGLPVLDSMQLNVDAGPECHEVDIVATDSGKVGNDDLSARTAFP
jgi:hypothetical protein